LFKQSLCARASAAWAASVNFFQNYPFITIENYPAGNRRACCRGRYQVEIGLGLGKAQKQDGIKRIQEFIRPLLTLCVGRGFLIIYIDKNKANDYTCY